MLHGGTKSGSPTPKEITSSMRCAMSKNSLIPEPLIWLTLSATLFFISFFDVLRYALFSTLIYGLFYLKLRCTLVSIQLFKVKKQYLKLKTSDARTSFSKSMGERYPMAECSLFLLYTSSMK